MKIKNLIMTSCTACCLMALFSCSNSTDAKNVSLPSAAATDTKENGQAAQTSTTAPAETAVVSFKVNGVEAKTQQSGKDKDPQIGMLNWQNKHMSVSLMGDDPKFPHRGFLTISVDGFKMEPATYSMSKECYVGFSRYATENAGGETQYSASVPGSYGTPEEKANNAKRKCTVTFSKVEKTASGFGEKYLVSGTFSATVTLSTGFKNEVPVIEITDGKFENVPVSVLGK